MNYTIDKQEHHTLVKPLLEKLDEVSGKAFKQELLRNLADANKFVILNLSNMFMCTEDGYIVLKALEKALKDMNGMLIITELQESIFRELKDSDLTLIPTDIEAIDFAFMDQLERHFLDPDNE